MRKILIFLTAGAALTAAILLAPACSPPAAGPADGMGAWMAPDPPGAAYDLEVTIAVEGDKASLAAAGSIALTNSARRPLSALAFEWTVRPADEFSLDLGGRPLKILNADRNMPATTPVLVGLPEPVGPGERIRLGVRFAARAAVTNGQVHFGLWYPRLWREGRPARDTFRVKIAAPAGFVAAVSGRRDPASGAYINDRVTSHFGLFLSNTMRVERREAGGVEISALFTEKGRACALFCLAAAADIIPFYKKWLGGYPHGSLVILPGGDRPMGGYPYASGMVVIHGQETFDPAKGEKANRWWTWITAHEIGHQYWGESVMSGDVLGDFTDSWLMIGLGICADKGYMLGKGYGWDRHRGFIDGYLGGVKARDDTTLDAPPSLVKTQKYDRNNVLIHGKGFAVLSALETVLGPETFDRAYRRAAREYAGRRLEWREFRRIAEAESGLGLDWFFEDWVRSSKILECRVVSKTSAPAREGFASEVRVEYGTNAIRMPVPVRALFADGTAQTAMTDRLAPVNLLRFVSRSPLQDVVLDPDGRLGLVQEAMPLTAAEIEEAVEALDWTGTGAAALEFFRNPETETVRTPHVWFKLGLLLFDGGSYPESLAAFQKCRERSTAKGDLFGALVWIGMINDLLGRRDAAIASYAEALKHDPGWTLQHDQYGLRIGKAWIEERLKSPFRWAPERRP
jgi:tetratricopeptide (TPR) repeat protein